MSERLDVYITANCGIKSRERAKQLIKKGLVSVDGKVCTKPSALVDENNEVECSPDDMTFVGRGGLKLEHACNVFELDLNGKVCADIGASTGGFTQCMLERGAAFVYAVDVGHGQLDKSLCSDNRVKNCEGVNARYLTADFFDKPVQFISGDLSFISLKLVIKPLCDCLCNSGEMVLLIKPQFEAGKQALNKKGIVKERKDHVRVITELLGCFRAGGLAAEKITVSPVKGGGGNLEYLILLKKAAMSEDKLGQLNIKEFVNEAFDSFRN
ncbi:TlyA family RNA methyltransferase [uncultured Ruminococcus sp.]|uniref:TlyA family RNA methyltransferase n=1 Tax=uncultured Ruminococcus sp. TaxID=165186 RepID=UPI0025D1FABA|nr:TlyA family RNA methyltransferase [uncultured Ruminococcus sp.]